MILLSLRNVKRNLCNTVTFARRFQNLKCKCQFIEIKLHNTCMSSRTLQGIQASLDNLHTKCEII